jgi:hypothetical protein
MPVRTGLSPNPRLVVTTRVTILDTTDQRAALIATAQLNAVAALVATSAEEVRS